MILAQHALEATLSPESVWKRWTEVATWPEWNHDLAGSSLDGAFRTGAVLSLRRAGGPVQKLVIVALEEGRSFTLEYTLLGARITVSHHLQPAPLGVRISQRVEARGWSSWLAAWLEGPQWRASLPGIVRALAKRIAGVDQK